MYLPDKSPIRSEKINAALPYYSEQNEYEIVLLSQIACALGKGLKRSKDAFRLPWIDDWGTAITLTITSEQKGDASPSLSLENVFKNRVKVFSSGGDVTIGRQSSLGGGLSAATEAIRTETIQFTVLNSDLIAFVTNYRNCRESSNGFQIDGDLKLSDTVFSRALLARDGPLSFYDKRSIGFNAKKFDHPYRPWEWPVFNTFTTDVTFTLTLDASVSPSWKLTFGTVNPVSPVFNGQAMYKNNLIVTMGPVTAPNEYQAAVLGSSAQAQHDARVLADAIRR